MALSGYPKAQENDADRAARAGLAILRFLTIVRFAPLNSRDFLQLAAGI
jgi:hypothetical protein